MTQNEFAIPAELIEALLSAERVTIMTGAGISAESGVPTFRDAQTGLWAKYDPQELATPQAFRQNPKLVWEWYAWRRALIANTRPNAGHKALAQLERLVPHLTLITQNIDSLHQAAGSANPIELHGNIARTKCVEVNLEPTPLTRYVDYALHGPAGVILPALVQQAFLDTDTAE